MKKYILGTLLIVCSIFFSIPTYADETDFMPEISDSDKSLTIHFYVQKTGVDVPIKGAEIGIYKIANLSCENGSANYTLLPEYNSVKKVKDGEDVTFNGISGTESEQLAYKINELVGQPDNANSTNYLGNCTFDGLSQGMYLVKEINAEGDAADYEFFSPYLLSVPLAVKNGESGNSWKYDVFSEPKTMIIVKDSDIDSNTDTDSDKHTDSDKSSSKSSSSTVSPPTTSSSNSQPKDVSKVKTGYISNAMIIIMIMSIAGFLMVVSIGNKQKEEQDETD